MLDVSPVKHTRVIRGRVGPRSTRDVQAEKQVWANLQVMSCNETHQVLGFDDLRRCPANCAFMAELDSIPCSFKCVQDTECGTAGTDAWAVIPDKDPGFCRRCASPGCDLCSDKDNPLPSVLKDQCDPKGCSLGWKYSIFTGECVMMGGIVLLVLKIVFGILLFIIAAWYLQLLLLRPAVNDRGVEEGLLFREDTKVLQPAEEGQAGRQPYPLTTNLQSSASAGIAGPGIVLHFNFQLAIILWALVMALVWFVTAELADHNLLIVGRRPGSAPAFVCALVSWGYDVQQRNIPVKVGYLIFAYAFTFLGTIIYTLVQHRRFCQMDDNTTMSDFVAIVRGLPTRSGSDASVEESTKAFLELKTGQPLVGVSVCWRFIDKAEDVFKATEAEMRELDEAWRQRAGLRASRSRVESDAASAAPRPLVVSRVFMSLDLILFTIVGGGEEEEDPPDPKWIRELLAGLETADMALAVFPTEEARDAAVEACKTAGGFTVPGEPASRVTLSQQDEEPYTVEFHNLGMSWGRFLWNLALGLVTVCVVQVAWLAAVFGPYAYFSLAFEYAHGNEPDAYNSFMFMIIVVAGNQVMYEVCARVGYGVGFQFKDKAEGCYIVLFTIANFINMVLELVIMTLLAYRQMIGMGASTVNGEYLSSLSTWQDIINSFSMQKALGQQTYAYNFPSTFFVPFLMEPFLTIIVVRHFMLLIVRSRAEMGPRRCERALQIFVPMDLCRYADVILNMTTGILALFFTYGYVLQTLLALAGCHVYILLLDHYRVLRCVPAFVFSSDITDRIAQWTLVIPCGMLLAALVWQSNCMSGPTEESSLCVRDGELLWRMLGAFALHTVLYSVIHCWLLTFFERCVPHQKAVEDFATVAARTPSSWFTENPVHCLRSKYVHGHEPPCIHREIGKEHLLRANPAAHSYFEQPERASCEQDARQKEKES